LVGWGIVKECREESHACCLVCLAVLEARSAAAEAAAEVHPGRSPIFMEVLQEGWVGLRANCYLEGLAMHKVAACRSWYGC